jgi:hypothetical protein
VKSTYNGQFVGATFSDPEMAKKRERNRTPTAPKRSFGLSKKEFEEPPEFGIHNKQPENKDRKDYLAKIGISMPNQVKHSVPIV